MNHTIECAGRLEQDYPTLPLTDLLLQKLQVVQLTEKDALDVVLLLGAHAPGTSGVDVVDAERLRQVLATDWGFYWTATTNLRKIRELVPRFLASTDAPGRLLSGRIDELLSQLVNAPKSTGWRLRGLVGPRVKWYRDVEREAQAS
jgi:hypothetical protein